MPKFYFYFIIKNTISIIFMTDLDLYFDSCFCNAIIGTDKEIMICCLISPQLRCYFWHIDLQKFIIFIVVIFYFSFGILTLLLSFGQLFKTFGKKRLMFVFHRVDSSLTTKNASQILEWTSICLFHGRHMKLWCLFFSKTMQKNHLQFHGN